MISEGVVAPDASQRPTGIDVARYHERGRTRLHKIDKDGKRHYLIRAIPYQDPQQDAERLTAVHEA